MKTKDAINIDNIIVRDIKNILILQEDLNLGELNIKLSIKIININNNIDIIFSNSKLILTP